MAMVAADMAEAIKIALGHGSEPTSTETTGMATAIIDELGVGVVAHVAGEVTGTASSPAGGNLSDGAATGGAITGMTGASLANKMKTEMGKPSITSQLSDMATEIVNHLLTATIEFAAGDIVGPCSHTSSSPGAFVGSGTGGTLQGLDGSALASSMAAIFDPSKPPSGELSDLCDAIVDYIADNAEVTYAPASVSGVIPAGGGSMQAGAGAGGIIS